MGALKKRILCVDDQQDAVVLVAMIIQGCEIVGANSKAEAIRKATSERFDLYLLDYHLPDGTGLELCLLIRVFDQHTPIFFCTGTSSITLKQIQIAGGQKLIRKGETFVDELRTAVETIS